MTFNKIVIILTLFTALRTTGFAQSDDSGSIPENQKIIIKTPDYKKNYVKVNLTSLAINNYGVQYERVLSRKFSALIAGRFMPSSSLPYKSFIKKTFIEDDPDAHDIIDQFRLNNFAITPEFKYYAGRGYGQGFYISLFYRFAYFGGSGIPVDYESNSGEEKSIDLSGNLSAHTGGFLLGLQKNIGKSLSVDFWFLGPHAGFVNGKFVGRSFTPLSAEDQQDIREELDKINIPMARTKASVDANGAVVKVDGPWAGLRMGLSFGIRF